MHEAATFMEDTLRRNVSLESEEFQGRLEKLRSEIKDVCDRFAITIPAKADTATAA